MREAQPKKDNTPKTDTREKEEAAQASDVSHESFWGAILFACMLFFVAASVAGVGWVVYTKWQSERTAKKQPSITVLSQQQESKERAQPAEPAPTPDSLATNDPRADDSVQNAKKLEVSVLNGGAVKGSAGVLANFLKQEGYSKTDSGNTQNNYLGVTIYFASGLEKEAATVKDSVAKKYPLAKILPADTKNKDTVASQVTIILGK